MEEFSCLPSNVGPYIDSPWAPLPLQMSKDDDIKNIAEPTFLKCRSHLHLESNHLSQCGETDC